MEVTHGAEMEFEGSKFKHRTGGIGFKTLSRGVEHTPENYILLLARTASFFSPRHLHNFDQFRYSIEGDFSLAEAAVATSSSSSHSPSSSTSNGSSSDVGGLPPRTGSLVLRQGQLSYHPEGVPYGPQNDGPEPRVALVLQCGGASGQGFMSFEQLKVANDMLAKRGTFDAGKFTDGKTGEVTDGYEAAWSEHNGGRKLEYPTGRYAEPIIISPDAFAWRPVKPEKEPGSAVGAQVWRKCLGVFSERELRVDMLKVAAGSNISLGNDDAIVLAYVLKGSGVASEVLGGQFKDEKHELKRESVVKLPAGSTAMIEVKEEVEILRWTLPLLA